MFLRSGFNVYLSKPIEIGKLNGIMDACIPARKKKRPGAADSEAPDSTGIFG
jgi:hypothetical protein